MRKGKGSITIFAALSMMLVASLLLALLEAARIHGLDYYAKKLTETGLESACAEYQPLLWQDYHILALDGSYGSGAFSMENVSGRVSHYVERNLEQKRTVFSLFGTNLFCLGLDEVEMAEYLLLTDGNGEVFLNLVAETMKETLPELVAQEIYEQYQEGKEIEEGGSKEKEETSDATELMADISSGMTEEDETKQASFAENLKTALAAKETLTEVAEIQESGWLKLVLGEEAEVSQKYIDLSDSIENRILNQGTMDMAEQKDWYRKVLVLEYLENYYSCYLMQEEDGAFSYEMEYLVGGKESEIENLETVVKRLLAIREAANITYILGNKEMVKIAEAIGTAVAALLSGNEPVGKVVTAAVIGAWAYLESVLDVRTLLSGGKISLLKSDEEWTTDVGSIIESFKQTAKAKDCEGGLSYQEYLKQILFFMGNQKLAYRMMNVMEQNLRKQELYQECRMDGMVVKLECQVSYTAAPLFSNLATIGKHYKGSYGFQKEMSFSYIP